MRFLTYLLVAAAGWWMGAAYVMASRPVQPFVTRISVQPANVVLNENCMETVRTCYARKRSAKIKGPE